MRAIGQFTITNICDVVASETAPENPYVGQLWVDTSVSPPESAGREGCAPAEAAFSLVFSIPFSPGTAGVGVPFLSVLP